MSTGYAYANATRPAGTSYYRTATYQPVQPQTQRPDVRDDYERWYTEGTANNRMVLALRSGIYSEVAWSLDRLCRLCHNEQFLLKSIPGLIDALFEWPQWYASEGYKETANPTAMLFSAPPEQTKQRRFALESLFILRNAALHEQNSWELSNHSKTLPLVLDALSNLEPLKDEHTEFLIHSIDLLHTLTNKLVISASCNPLVPLHRLVAESSNRSLIISSLTVTSLLLSNPRNYTYITAQSPALGAAIRYLPLFVDKALIDAALNYLYTHLSHSHMAKAFLLHPEMPGVLRLLVSLLIHEQVEEKVSFDVTGVIHTVPATTTSTRDHDLTPEELQSLLEKPEPQRCFDWMRTMFVAKADGEVTQVDFWNLYKDSFSPYPTKHPLLVASDVIKNVSLVFPQAQAMVLQEPIQRFIVRGVDRRKDAVVTEKFKCHWDRSSCTVAGFATPGELYDHLLQHLSGIEWEECPCLWSTCPKTTTSKAELRLHTLTHLSSSQPPEKHPSQSDTITLPSADSPYPTSMPTVRPPPPPRSTIISYSRPTVDPPSTSLTALLCIRLLFRTSFASADAAPRADADHFGFPGIVEEPEDQEMAEVGNEEDSEREGERRGRRAFVGVRRLLEGVRIRDEVLMGWITEMMDAGITGTTS
ncbi:hypothetical protein AX16_000282 [Volvariella volvacea WC 439]|nr:hypothetical protein AX16_000282 [Volvariella volvacea WC 439]